MGFGSVYVSITTHACNQNAALLQLFAQLDDAPATDDEDDGKSLSSEEESVKPELRERQDLLDSDHSDNDSEVGIGDILASTAEVLDEERHERLKEVTLGDRTRYPFLFHPFHARVISY